MIITNGKVFQEDGSYKVMDLYVENGRLVSSPEEVTDKTQLDAAGLKVLPGLVDIHSHGAKRHDFSDADTGGLKVILQYEKSQGVTSYCPTSMTPVSYTNLIEFLNIEIRNRFLFIRFQDLLVFIDKFPVSVKAAFLRET